MPAASGKCYDSTLPCLPQDAGQKRSREDKEEVVASEAAKHKQEEEEEALPNLDADITPEEMQMMQAMGIPFVSGYLEQRATVCCDADA